jgi:hypothetical protein
MDPDTNASGAGFAADQSASRMDPQIKAQWVEALRSGEYQQGKRRLHTVLPDGSEEMCCLGVLSHLAHLAGTCPRQAGERRYTYGAEKNSAVLPREVMAWAGLLDDSPMVSGVELAEHNDGDLDGKVQPKSFIEIADLIERDL